MSLKICIASHRNNYFLLKKQTKQNKKQRKEKEMKEGGKEGERRRLKIRKDKYFRLNYNFNYKTEELS